MNSVELLWWLLQCYSVIWHYVSFLQLLEVLVVVLCYNTLNSSWVTDGENSFFFVFSRKRSETRLSAIPLLLKKSTLETFPLLSPHMSKPSRLRLTSSCVISHWLWHTESLITRSSLKLQVGDSHFLNYELEMKSNQSEIRWLVVSHTCKGSDRRHESKHTALRRSGPRVTFQRHSQK